MLLNYLELLLMVIFLSCFFLMSMQPVFMVGLLMLITLLYSFYMYKIMMSYWFSYILVMVMLSGVLVVFTYMISLLPNEKFEIYNLIFIFMILITYCKVEDFFLEEMFSEVCLYLWNSYLGVFNLFLVSFLLSVMIMVVWISCLSEGAVRSV